MFAAHSETRCMKGLFMHIKLLHVRQRWLILATDCIHLSLLRLWEIALNSLLWWANEESTAMFTCTAHLIGRVTSEKNLGILTGKEDQIFHLSKTLPVLPVQQLLLFKQWKHFHHFMSNWNCASWTARDGQEAAPNPWSDSRLNTSGHREMGNPTGCRQWEGGDGSQLYTAMEEYSVFPYRGGAKPDILMAQF